MFPIQSHNVSPFVHIFDIISVFAAELEKPKIGISGKGLKCQTHDLENFGLSYTETTRLSLECHSERHCRALALYMY